MANGQHSAGAAWASVVVALIGMIASIAAAFITTGRTFDARFRELENRVAQVTSGLDTAEAMLAQSVRDLQSIVKARGAIILVRQRDGATCPTGFEYVGSLGVSPDPQDRAGANKGAAVSDVVNELRWPLACVAR